MNPDNCAVGSLNPFVPSQENPWNRKRILHLFRRFGFGDNIDEVNDALQKNPAIVVDNLIDHIINHPTIPPPDWKHKLKRQYSNFDSQSLSEKSELESLWYDWMVTEGYRQKLILFWHNHFVTQFSVYQCPSYLYQYFAVLEKNALGNFKTFVREIGLTPAMLLYLNGFENVKGKPNENYARELLELFTLGKDQGYTQNDIKEIARALTGYNPDSGTYLDCGAITFNTETFDVGVKRIFDEIGNFDYNDVVDLIFEKRGTELAKHICTKIYRHFVNPCPHEEIIDELATIFIQNDFELTPVFQALFKSEHFFDEFNIGVCVKSPVFLVTNLSREITPKLYGTFGVRIIQFFIERMGQLVFEPPNVAGWEGDKSWINTQTIALRWQYIEFLLSISADDVEEEVLGLVKNMTQERTDVKIISNHIVDYFLGNGLQSDFDYLVALEVFKGNVPETYFKDGTWTLDYPEAYRQVLGLIGYISKLPEFQLH